MARATAGNTLDERAMRIVNTALIQLGGVGELVKRRKTDILPALTESAYVLVLSQEKHRTPEQISEDLGLTLGAVQSILQAPTEGFEERLRYEVDEAHEFERHTDPQWSDTPSSGRLDTRYLVGALAKSAYTVVRREEGTLKSYP
jgi:predicted transcriptional regulator